MEPSFSRKKILIVGGGLAGTFAAARLCQDGHEVTLVNEPRPDAASVVAAGMFNVITGRFGALTWQAAILLKEIHDFLDEADFQHLKRFFHFVPIYRPFKNIEEYNQWSGRALDERFSPYMAFQEKTLPGLPINNELGGIFITPCGWCEVGPLVQEMTRTLIEKFGLQFLETHAPAAGLVVGNKSWEIDGQQVKFDDLVLCPGAWGSQFPLLGKMPLIPNKGETLTLGCADLDLDFVLSRKAYLIPLGAGRFVAGSTYQNQFADNHPTAAARNEILAMLKDVVQVDFEVLEHRAGLRPTTPNRRPILGTHSDYLYVHIISGFGTKGVLTAPWASVRLREFFRSGNWDLPQEANRERFGLI